VVRTKVFSVAGIKSLGTPALGCLCQHLWHWVVKLNYSVRVV